MRWLPIIFLLGCTTLMRQKPIYRLAWIKNLDPVYDAGNLPIGHLGPTIGGGKVFVGTLEGKFYAYAQNNGKELWHRKEKAAIGNTPLYFDEKVVYGTVGGRILSRNALNGDLIYAVDVGAEVSSQGTLHEGRLFFHLMNHSIVALDFETGKVLWNYKRSISQSPTLHRTSKPWVKNKVIVGMADGVVVALSKEEGRLLWEVPLSLQEKFADVDTAPVTWNGKILVASYRDKLRSLNSKNGVLTERFAFSSARRPLVRGEDFYSGSLEGHVVRYGQGRVLKKVSLDNTTVTSLNFWNGHIVAGTLGGRIFFLDPNDLEVRRIFDFGGTYSGVFSHIVSSNNYLAFMSSRNRLYVLSGYSEAHEDIHSSKAL